VTREEQLEKLCGEIYGVFAQTMFEARFTDEETKQKAFAAMQVIDRKVREAGVKGFPARFVRQEKQSGTDLPTTKGNT